MLLLSLGFCQLFQFELPLQGGKCEEDLLTAPLGCQTGPLRLHLILCLIHNCSESTLDLLLAKVRTLKISNYDGKDIDDTVQTSTLQ